MMTKMIASQKRKKRALQTVIEWSTVIVVRYRGEASDAMGRAFDFELDAGRLRITVVSSRTIRVQASRSDVLRGEPSWSVVGLGTETTCEVSKGDTAWHLRTPDLSLTLEFAPLRIVLRDSTGTVIAEDDTTGGIEWTESGFVCRRTMLGEERFYGLGEKAHGLDKRGLYYEMWNTDDPEYGPDSDPLYQSIPFFIVLRDGRAHGVFLDNSYRTFFDLASTSAGHYAFGAPDGPLDYYVFVGPRMRDVIDAYTSLTGRPHLVPRWAMGHQHSRWMEYESEDDILSLAREYRRRAIPCDTLVLDIAYMDGYRIFTWDRQVFPDPSDFVARLGQMGFQVMTIIDPGVKKEEGFDLYDEGLASDYFLRNRDGSVYVGLVWPGETVFPDFSRSEVREWFASKYERLSMTSLSSWLDMNEPSNCIYVGLREEYSMRNVVDSEGRPWEPRLRNLYGLHMTISTFDGLKRLRPSQRPFILTRSGFAGYQRYAATWTGDNRSSWEHLRLSIPMLLNLGLSGVPICGADVGGFWDDVTGDLLARWYQVGCFYPFFRNHSNISSARQEPWLFGPEVEDIIRQAIDLRYSLLRYLYSLAWEAHTTGCPIMRPLVLEFQDDVTTYALDDQFMVGPALMVAPIVRPGMESREVYFPRGIWYSLWTDEHIIGPTHLTVEAPLRVVPVFVRGGHIIPTGRVVQHTGEDQGDLILWAFPGGSSEFVFFEDDGISNVGNHSVTPMRFETTSSGGYRLSLGQRLGAWVPPSRRIRVQFRAVSGEQFIAYVDGRPTDSVIKERYTEVPLSDDGLPHVIELTPR